MKTIYFFLLVCVCAARAIYLPEDAESNPVPVTGGGQLSDYTPSSNDGGCGTQTSSKKCNDIDISLGVGIDLGGNDSKDTYDSNEAKYGNNGSNNNNGKGTYDGNNGSNNNYGKGTYNGKDNTDSQDCDGKDTNDDNDSTENYGGQNKGKNNYNGKDTNDDNDSTENYGGQNKGKNNYNGKDTNDDNDSTENYGGQNKGKNNYNGKDSYSSSYSYSEEEIDSYETDEELVYGSVKYLKQKYESVCDKEKELEYQIKKKQIEYKIKSIFTGGCNQKKEVAVNYGTNKGSSSYESSQSGSESKECGSETKDEENELEYIRKEKKELEYKIKQGKEITKKQKKIQSDLEKEIEKQKKKLEYLIRKQKQQKKLIYELEKEEKELEIRIAEEKYKLQKEIEKNKEQKKSDKGKNKKEDNCNISADADLLGLKLQADLQIFKKNGLSDSSSDNEKKAAMKKFLQLNLNLDLGALGSVVDPTETLSEFILNLLSDKKVNLKKLKANLKLQLKLCGLDKLVNEILDEVLDLGGPVLEALGLGSLVDPVTQIVKDKDGLVQSILKLLSDLEINVNANINDETPLIESEGAIEEEPATPEITDETFLYDDAVATEVKETPIAAISEPEVVPAVVADTTIV